MLENVPYLIVLAIGFGFVVFWHELGHFLAAKWAGVKVEQFAVGFAHAVVSWRKGMGFRLGGTRKEFDARLEAWLTDTAARKADGTADQIKGSATDGWTDGDVGLAARSLKISETEYRLNWLPLGGYVKMLGQDDLRPDSEADDPRAYNRQSVGKRMVIISAGVIMNVILAAFLFIVLFMYGFDVPPAKIGGVYPGSPAQQARPVDPALANDPQYQGLPVGGVVKSFDGKVTQDNTKLALNSALSASGEPVSVVVVRPDGQEVEYTVTPRKLGGMVAIGVTPSVDLAGVKYDEKTAKPVTPVDAATAALTLPPEALLIQPGDTILAINGVPVKPDDQAVLDKAVQTGEQVTLTLKTREGKEEERSFVPDFAIPFGGEPFQIAGFVPRVQIEMTTLASFARGRLLPGDVVTQLSFNDKIVSFPSFTVFQRTLKEAGAANAFVTVTVLRNARQQDGTLLPTAITEKDLKVFPVSRGTYGLGVIPGVDELEPIVAETLPDTPAAGARIPPKSKLLQIGETQVSDWRGVHHALRAQLTGRDQGATLKVKYQTEGGETKEADLVLAAADVKAVGQIRYDHGLALAGSEIVRKQDNILAAMGEGIGETRDFILQFYVTLRRMASRDVDPSNLLGPVGIFQAGTRFASRGGDWFIWFLAMISANLAVVNFLPIPVVDGGHFVFLMAEKLRGKPVSQKIQAFAQYVGIVLLLSLILFVTYQDIANFNFR